MYLPQRVAPRPAAYFSALIICLISLLSVGQAGAQTSSTPGTLQCSPTSLSFGNVTVGQSKSLTATLTNTGNEKVTINSMSAGKGFTLSGLSMPYKLYRGLSVSITVTFAPTTSGQVSQDASIVSDAANGTVILHLSGTGAAQKGSLTANPTSQSFGNVQVNSSKTLSQTLTNSSSSSITISTAAITGTGFTMTGLSVPLTLTANHSVTFSVVFSPKTSGSASGSISITSNGSVTKLTIPLTGTGTAAGTLTVSPTSLSFGNVTVGTSKSLTGTLTAAGSSVTVSSVSVSSSEFVVSGLTFPFTLTSGQSSYFTVKFSPQTSGAASGTASFVSNASNSPTVQSLSGTGTGTTQHNVSLTWDPSTSTVNGYNVYRGGTSGGPYTKINTALDATVSYVDSTVQSGKTYYYVTTAVDAAGKESGYSNQVQAVIPFP